MSTVFDIETDGLDPTLIHVVSWSDNGGKIESTHDYNEMRRFFLSDRTFVGHNIIRYDVPAVEKLLKIKIRSRMIDTLALSWYVNHHLNRHGLGEYGENYGIPKPQIDDWENLTQEEYKHRCEEDVKINNRLWRDLSRKLNKLYPDGNDVDRLIDYLTFKMECAASQETLRWKLDLSKAEAHLKQWEIWKEEKVEQLSDAMPRKVITKTRNRPKVYYRKDGSLSTKGQEWEELCKVQKHPTSTKSLTIIAGYERGNPNSPEQVKEWLFSLGWKPRTFKFLRDKDTGGMRQLEQVRKDGELCESVRILITKDKDINFLDGLSVLSHRIGVIRSIIEAENNGYVQATIAGFTNTLRFRHRKPLVNLPSIDKPYGKEIRECLTCPEGDVLCGADMTSLEDTTKRHYMKPLDPDYVEEMSQKGFDPHLDLAKHAGIITQEDIDRHNSGERSLKSLRKNYKVVNYSATYGIGAPKLARETGMSQGEAKTLLDAFWSRNWAVEKVAEELTTRELFGSTWVLNPVSNFWYSLRSQKDRFSTLNQGTGVFCFDSWVAICRSNKIKVIGQFHDEIIALVKAGEEEETKGKMEGAIKKLNEKLKLNVPLGVDAQFGSNYADIH